MVFGLGGYPPFYISGHDGEDENPATLTGMFPEFLDAFSKAHPEFDIRPVILPQARMDLWMATGQAQAFCLNSPIFLDDADQGRYRFTTPLWWTGDHLVVRAADRSRFRSKEDLVGLKVGLVLGYGYGPFQAFINSREVQPVYGPHDQALVRMLHAGRVEAIVSNRDVLAASIRRLGYEREDFAALEPSLYEFGLSVMIQADRTEFFQAMESFVLQSRADGLLDRLASAWLHP